MNSESTRVLLIEDNDADAATIRRLLRRARTPVFEIERARTLSEGLAQLERAHRADVVLLDLSLPDSHHSVSALSMLAHSPDIPVIVLTGHTDEQAALEIVQQGVMDYLIKDDLNEQVLVRSVRYAIERLRVLEQLRSANRQLAGVNTQLEQRVAERTERVREMEIVARQQQQELAHVSRLNLAGELSAGLAHELNQPLMAIAAFSRSAQQRLAALDIGAADVDSLLVEISDEAKRAGEIIQRLRQMVQRREPQKTVVDLAELLSETASLVRHELRSAGVNLILPKTRRIAVRTDTIQLQQVLINLIQNAVRAVRSLGEDSRVVELRLETARESVALVVENRFDELDSDPSAWFEPFYSTSPDGMGLGLPISRRIMTTLGGNLTAERTDVLVRMTVTLPRH